MHNSRTVKAAKKKVVNKDDKSENTALHQYIQEGLDSGFSNCTSGEIRQNVIDRLEKDGKLQIK